MFEAVLWPSGAISKIARLLGILSALALLKYALGSTIGFPFSSPAEVLLELYDCSVGYILSAIEPHVRALLDWLRALFSIELELRDHWRHVSVLTGIYLSRSVWTAFKNNVGAALSRLVFALILAPAAGVASGVINPAQNAVFANFLIGSFPVMALLVYGVLNGVYQATFSKAREIARRPHLTTWWAIFSGHALAAARRTIAGLLLLFVFVILLDVAFLVPNAGLVSLSLLVVCLGFYFLWDGKKQALASSEKRGSNWKSEYWLADSTLLGASVLGVALGSVFGIGLDWVLAFVGVELPTWVSECAIELCAE